MRPGPDATRGKRSHGRENLRHRHAPGQVSVPGRFRGVPQTAADEPPPLGDGAGPSQEQLLGAAVANCLCASFLFAVSKFKGDPGRLTATAICETGRNENDRLRVTQIKVDIALGAPPEQLPHLDRAFAQFEEFCTVTQSVRAGIPVAVCVQGPDGRGLN
jgi:organic hydroperoxide reductase OsmC/OhrA